MGSADTGTRRAEYGAAVATFEDLMRIETDDCVHWPYYRLPNGYGVFNMVADGVRRKVYVHREALRRRVGDPPTARERYASHLPIVCHNPSCMNYRHLRWATASQNALDRKLDGTEVCGERHHASVLTAVDVRVIRRRYSAGETFAAIGRTFGVSYNTVARVISGESWKAVI